ncbi:dihydropteroate synthase [Nautilia profundicola AmH]|uniref:dihydropteroate synthase n=1 Tax=Nautilia profundicola (strain ATCC BAA-1463 / DSM 18972 / AmH) TaxID=598659 RepID=B9LAE7_NAUPA|nr:dihydropteroate synthase [Nautilia profundicola]ACM93452.1 dihydropteroate synthase [Nautilia profundicola AmH]
MKVYKLNCDIDLSKLLLKIGVDKPGIEIMKKKKSEFLFYIKDMNCGAANILKQDALSIGAELAVPMGVPNCKNNSFDAVLMCNKKQLELLVKKELAQPFKLKILAKELKEFIDLPKFPLKIMGVINANEDSFFEGSRFKGSNAVREIENMINDGAKIIDIGGVSSRPGSVYPGVEEELKRVKPIIDEIYNSKLYEKAVFSIDTFEAEVLEYALERGFKIANDITGLESDEYAKVAAKYGASVIIMHKKGNPKDMQKNPFYENVILEVDEFFQRRIEKAKSFGIKDIVLDVGIGFGKRLEDNIALIKHMEHFLHFGYELLIGASRKSMIDMIMQKEGLTTTPAQRLPGTLIIHTEAVRNGASIVRCHDVKEHFQALKVFEAIRDFDV